jgi:hypothetical protein
MTTHFADAQDRRHSASYGFVPIISFIVSVGILVAGVNLSAPAVDLQHSLSPARKLRTLSDGGLVYLIALLATLAARNSSIYVILIPFFGVPVGYLLYFGKERLLIGVNSLLFMMMSFCLLYVPFRALKLDSGDSVFEFSAAWGAAVAAITMLFPICWMAVILFSPLRQLTRRLSFVVLRVLTLVVLSEISKLHQYLQPTLTQR